MSDYENVYASPNAQEEQEEFLPEMSGFSKGLIITDIVFCSLRVLIVLFVILGIMLMKGNEQLKMQAFIEVFIGLVMIICGFIGNIMLLKKKRAGISWAWCNVTAALISCLVALYFTMDKIEAMSGAQQMGGIVGLVGVLSIRVVFLGFYIKAFTSAKPCLED